MNYQKAGTDNTPSFYCDNQEKLFYYPIKHPIPPPSLFRGIVYKRSLGVTRAGHKKGICPLLSRQLSAFHGFQPCPHHNGGMRC